MAMLRRRRGRSSTPPQEPTPAPPRPSGPPLEEQLRQIAATTAPEEALEPALRMILETTGIHAGALCLFDPRYGLMRLAAETGLSEEGCARLRSVRRGDPSSWDMPLHGLLNRRAYLIESAPRNRYVPPLTENPASVRTVACVPIYGNASPLGSLILIALSPRMIMERDIHALEAPLREVAGMIEAARRRGGIVEEPQPFRPNLSQPVLDVVGIQAERDRLRDELATRHAERASLAAELAARSGENDHLRVALEQAGDERRRLTTELERAHREAERATTLSTSLAAAERERARLAAALETAAATRAEETQTLIRLEQARVAAERAAASALADLESTRRTLGSSAASAGARVTELGAELERLQARLVETEAAAAHERTRASERDAEHHRLTAALAEATAREQQARADLRAAAERTVADGTEELRQALTALAAAEQAQAAAQTEAQVVRAALESTQAIVEALEHEAAQAHVELERLQADARATQNARERIEEQLSGTSTREREAGTRVAELERELGALGEERNRLAAAGREQEAALAAHAARLEALAAERDRLGESLATAVTERERLLADAAAASSTHARLEEALAREATERARLGGALGELQQALSELEATQARHDAEASARTTEIERLRGECERLTVERDRLRIERPSADDAPPAPAEPPVRVVTVAAAGGGRGRSREREVAGTGNTIAVLDLDNAWQGAAPAAHAVSVLAPGAEAIERLSANAPERIVVNLAAPGALETIIALRGAGSTARVWGCLAAPGTDRGLLLGMIEPTTRPLDADAVLGVLGNYAVRGTRVVTAGADVDALMSLRQALARQGMSVSMAWDAKQARDLLGVVRPEVAVVDLALPRRDGYTIVAALATCDPAPNAILVPGDGDAAAAFAAALADPLQAGHVVPLDRVLATVVGRSEDVPTEKRQKVRAIGRK